MSRTVAALYDSRDEAELARLQLASQIKVPSARVIGKDTAAAVDSLKIAPRTADTYRKALRSGAHLLVADVPSGTSAKRLVQLLEAPARPEDFADRLEGEQGVRVEIPDEPPAQSVVDDVRVVEPSAAPEEARQKAPSVPQPRPIEREPNGEKALEASAPAPVVDEARIPVASEELRIGVRREQRGGARIRSFTRESPAEEQVALREEAVDVDKRPSGRRLSDAEVEAGGLFQQRVFEAAEMREEPVVTKVAVVREEVIVRKTVRERTETVRDMIRHTEVEVEDLAAEDGADRPFVASRRGPNT